MKTLILLGPAGSFSDIAAARLAGTWQKKYASSFAELFRLVKRKKCYGLVPIHNKIVGGIREATRFLKKDRFRILKTIKMPICLILAAKPGVELQDIRRVYCSKVVKRQCEKFLGKFLSRRGGTKISPHLASSSAVFKKIVQLKENSAAAIGSEYAAKLYGLQVLARNIQDDKKDWTEFALVSSL